MAGMRPESIGDLIDIADPRLSPDGARVAFVVTTVDLEENEYRSRVWLAHTDGSVAPQPFTAGDRRDGRPRWSPDGRWLAFVSHRADEGSELYVIPVVGGGELRRVASWPEEIEDVSWSPDGTRLAFAARERDEEHYGKTREKDRPPRRVHRLHYRLDNVGWTSDRVRQLFLVRVDGASRPAPLTRGEWPVGGFEWSGDGTRLVFASGRHETWDTDSAVDLWIVDARPGAECARLTATGPSYSQPVFDRAGGRVACMVVNDPQSAPRHGQIAVVALDGDAPLAADVRTALLDRQCAPFGSGARPVWDGDDVLFTVEDRGNVSLYRVASAGPPKPVLVLGGERHITGFDAVDGTIAYVAATPSALAELFVYAGGQERALTGLGRSFAERYEIAVPERFTATSSDGTEVEAWIMRPIGAEAGRRHPLLLNVHGGPFTQYGNRLFDEFQIQASSGYAVLYSNPRGSSGYSEAWGRAIRGPNASVDPGSGWGGVDYDDLMAVVDTAVATYDFVDPERLGILGGSYGGYMTSWVVGHTDRFMAALSERAVNNLLSASWTSDIGIWFYPAYLEASHLDDADEYLRQSPLTYAANVRTPLLILHSEQDLRCPIEQAEQLFVALKRLGREVEFVRFPGEGHELSRSGSPRHRVMRAEVVLDWFARKLTP
jgi:dipeptidyl aminopeptidase/acylaminoacyl peptidase